MGIFKHSNDSHGNSGEKEGSGLSDLLTSPYIPFVLGIFTMSFLVAEKTYDYTTNQHRTLDSIQEIQLNLAGLKNEIIELKLKQNQSNEENKDRTKKLTNKLDKIESKIVELEKALIN